MLTRAAQSVLAHDRVSMSTYLAQVSPGDVIMDNRASGVSGFAFQGTNAHVILRSHAVEQRHVSEGLALSLQKSDRPACIAQRHTLCSLLPE